MAGGFGEQTTTENGSALMASKAKNKASSNKHDRPAARSGQRAQRRGSNMSANIQWLALITIFVLVVVAIFAFGFGDGSGVGGGHN